MIYYLALAARITLLGFERIVVKKLGQRGDNIDATFLFFGIGALFLLPFALYKGFGSWGFLKYALIASFIYSFGFVFYVRSLAEGDVSLVTPVANTNILFLFILSILFLGESVTPLKTVGIILIFFGAARLKKGGSFFKSLYMLLHDIPCRHMMIFALLTAVGRIIDKKANLMTSPVVYSFTIYSLISLNLLLYIIYKKRTVLVKGLFKEKTAVALTSGAINAYSYLFLLFAMNRFEVSVVEPLSMSSVLIAAFLGKLFFDEPVKERIPGILIILFGSWLLLS